MYGSSTNEFNFPPEDSDVWPPSGIVSGDFYREPDNVCRGVTISAGDLRDDAFGFKGDFVDSEFYSQPDDVCKGITLNSYDGVGPGDVPVPFGFKSDFASSEFYGQPDDLCKGLTLTGSAYDGYSNVDSFGKSLNSQKSGSGLKEDLLTAHFTQGEPPAAPTDSLFKLELTTIYAKPKSGQEPCILGNAVLDFFRKKTSSVLTKVTYKKYAMKLDVFAGSAMFSMKARVYTQTQQYAIEFQRRSGDTVSFNRIFQEAKDFLSNRSELDVEPQHFEAPRALQLPFCPPFDDFLDPNEDNLSPLYDLCSIPVPQLQAEAAESLHKAAKEGSEGIYKPRTFRSIYELLQSSSTEVLLPTSCLLREMAKAPQARALFASEGMVAKLQSKASSNDIPSEIRVILSQAYEYVR